MFYLWNPLNQLLFTIGIICGLLTGILAGLVASCFIREVQEINQSFLINSIEEKSNPIGLLNSQNDKMK